MTEEKDRATRVKAFLGLTARLALGGVFIYAGLIKLLAPAEEFAYAIETYKVTGPALSLWAAYIMPWLELFSGLLLSGGIFTRFNALLCGAMLLFFEALLAQAWLRGLEVTSCGCFGSGGSNSLPVEFAQNLVFLALACLAFRHGGAYSADAAVGRPAPRPLNSDKETL